MKRRRVKITGIGLVTPAGVGNSDFWSGILKPVSRVGRIQKFHEDAGEFVGAEVPTFKLDHYLPRLNARKLPRHTQFALAASALAIADAEIPSQELKKNAIAIVVGASLMDFGSINRGIDLILRKGPAHGLPTTVFDASVSSIGGAIGDAFAGVFRSIALQSACCAGLDSIGHAFELVSRGDIDIALCGGTEAPLYFHPMLELKMAGLAPSNSIDPARLCRPFDLWRTTGVIGEGSCILVIEPEDSPRTGYCFIEGYSFETDVAGRPGGGLAGALELVLANARLRRSEIDTISAWGPGHKLIDASEADALWRVFGPELKEIPVVSIKGAIGNALGAAGAIQVGCAALGLKYGLIPPTVNWQYPDPACALNLCNQVRRLGHCTALINSHGLSGSNACLILKH